jgi:hypothetical protein
MIVLAVRLSHMTFRCLFPRRDKTKSFSMAFFFVFFKTRHPALLVSNRDGATHLFMYVYFKRRNPFSIVLFFFFFIFQICVFFLFQAFRFGPLAPLVEFSTLFFLIQCHLKLSFLCNGLLNWHEIYFVGPKNEHKLGIEQPNLTLPWCSPRRRGSCSP